MRLAAPRRPTRKRGTPPIVVSAADVEPVPEELAARSPHRWLLGLAIVLVAFNLRSAVSSIGPVLTELQDSLHVSSSYSGVLTTLPVLCFAVFGLLVPLASRRVRTERLTVLAVVTMVIGLLIRALTGSPVVFLALSAVALAGIAGANVLLPVLVKRHFPDRIGSMTALYTASMALGSTAGAAVSVPLAHAVSWRFGIGIWAAVAAVSLLPWLSRHVTPPRVATATGGEVATTTGGEVATATGGAHAEVAAPPRALTRSPVAWAIVVYFGAQSLGGYVMFGWLPAIYRSAGFSAQTAGLLLALVTAVAIPVSLVMPTVAARARDQRGYAVGSGLIYMSGYAGLLVAPHAGAWVWACLLGLAGACFPIALTMIGLRTATPRATAALSSFGQGAGYLLAAIGPVTVGVLHGATGSWDWPLIFVVAMLALLIPSGLVAGRARQIA